MSVNRINFNSDLAEQDWDFYETVDKKLISKINSANISCLYHGGMEAVVQQAVAECHQHEVSIGAHVSFLDKENFGRTSMPWTPIQIQELLKVQIEFMSKVCKQNNTKITHIKPHGALNNMACKDADLSQVIIDYIKRHYPSLIILAPALSKLALVAENEKMQTVLEIFADRTYEDDGTLTSRAIDGSLITNPQLASKHVEQMLLQGAIISRSGAHLPTSIHSICLHSDTPNSVEISNEICILLHSMGIKQIAIPHLF